MAGAMRNLTGIEPDYVMVTRFPFFEDMVNDIGGITVTNPRRFYDPYLKKEGFKQGRIHLDGYNAMAFSRIRKGLAGGDFDRSANQQRTLRGIQARIRSQASKPGFIERGVMTVMEHMATNASPAELFELAQAVAQVDPRKITTCVVPGTDRLRRRRERRVPRRRPGAAARSRGAPRCVPAPLLSVELLRLRQDSNLRHLVPETSALSPELRRPTRSGRAGAGAR